MSSDVKFPPAKIPARKEIVANFDPIAMRAPFFLRCAALVFDYLFIVIWPVIGMLFGRYLGIDGAKLITGELNNFSWLIAMIVAACNLILLPIATGQSLGKMIAGLRIVSSEGGHPSVGPLVLRQTLGYLLTLATVGLGFLLSVFGRKGRALHDYISGTQVVFGTTRIRS